VTGLSDPTWLRECVESGASISDIAAAPERKKRTIWYHLQRHNIPTPDLYRRARVDRDALFDAWRRGDHVDDIAVATGFSVAWVRDAVRNVPRRITPPRRARPSRFPQLNDAAWLRAQLAAGRSIGSIASEVGTDRHNLRYMLRRHGLR
jgi:hypothetical protein